MDFLNFVSLTDVQVLSSDGAFLRLESGYPHLQPAVVQSKLPPCILYSSAPPDYSAPWVSLMSLTSYGMEFLHL